MSAAGAGALRRATFLGDGPAGVRRVSYVVGDSAVVAGAEAKRGTRFRGMVVLFVIFVCHQPISANTTSSGATTSSGRSRLRYSS